jgi:hypothetical protein
VKVQRHNFFCCKEILIQQSTAFMENVSELTKEYVPSLAGGTQEEYKEGPVARRIEGTTAKLPSDLFLWAAVASMGTSLTLKIMGKKHDALFVGQWAAPFLLFGLYNKIVKVAGHDKAEGETNGAEL